MFKDTHTVGCRYKTVQYNMITHKAMHKLRHYLNQSMYAHVTTHIWPSMVRYGLPIIRISKTWQRFYGTSLYSYYNAIIYAKEFASHGRHLRIMYYCTDMADWQDWAHTINNVSCLGTAHVPVTTWPCILFDLPHKTLFYQIKGVAVQSNIMFAITIVIAFYWQGLTFKHG